MACVIQNNHSSLGNNTPPGVLDKIREGASLGTSTLEPGRNPRIQEAYRRNRAQSFVAGSCSIAWGNWYQTQFMEDHGHSR